MRLRYGRIRDPAVQNVDAPRKRIDAAALQAVTDAMPMLSESAREFIRRMRDEDRY